MSGFSFQATITKTTSGNSRLTGKAARNCATAWTFCEYFGRSPIQTATGTQNSEASPISSSTRASVMPPRPTTCSTSLQPTSSCTKTTSL